MRAPIKRGTARRLGLRAVPGTIRLAHISGAPEGDLWAVAGCNGRSWIANARGSAVHQASVVIHRGMLNGMQVRGVGEP